MGCGSSSSVGVSNDNSNKRNYQRPVNVNKPVAFNITFDDDKPKIEPYEAILKQKAPPPRFALEPIKEKPKLTQRQIEEKMRLVEQKREEILMSKTKAQIPRNKSFESQDRRFNGSQKLAKIDNSLITANKQRNAILDERKEKQRKNDEKRQRIIQQKHQLTRDELRDFEYDRFESDNHYNNRYDDF